MAQREIANIRLPCGHVCGELWIKLICVTISWNWRLHFVRRNVQLVFSLHHYLVLTLQHHIYLHFRKLLFYYVSAWYLRWPLVFAVPLYIPFDCHLISPTPSIPSIDILFFLFRETHIPFFPPVSHSVSNLWCLYGLYFYQIFNS